ncbi:MAG: hypothetical protein AVDCRST_MAG54-2523, partial [uncultured Actinomycetospora sp.]
MGMHHRREDHTVTAVAPGGRHTAAPVVSAPVVSAPVV